MASRNIRKSKSARKSGRGLTAALSRKSKKNTRRASGRGRSFVDEFFGLLLIGAALLVTVGAYFEKRGINHVLSGFLHSAVGLGLWVIVLALMYFGVLKFRSRSIFPNGASIFGWLLMLPVVCGCFETLGPLLSEKALGGAVGWFVFHYLSALTSPLSASLLLVLFLLLSAMVAFNAPISELLSGPGNFVMNLLVGAMYIVYLPFAFIHRAVLFILFRLHRLVYWILEDLSTIGEYLARSLFPRRTWASSGLSTSGRAGRGARAKVNGDKNAENVTSMEPGPDVSVNTAPAPVIKALNGGAEIDDGNDEPGIEEEEEPDDSDKIDGPTAAETEEDASGNDESSGGRMLRRARSARKGQQLKLFTDPGRRETMAKTWRRPGIELFDKAPLSRRGEEDQFLRDRGAKLVETLRQFKIEAEVLKIVPGPTITQYQIRPASGIKLSRITALSNDIAMALACRSVRIEAPIPGKSAVGIEVPNSNPESVLFSEMISHKNYLRAQTRSRLAFVLGKSISGQPIIADLRKMPHLLVAGATGSGKSVCINTVLASILYNARPDQCRMLMIDPKMVELVSYNGIPHLVTDVVTNPQDAGTALRWAVLEMERRYRYLSRFGARNIESYNQQLLAGELVCEDDDSDEKPVVMPYMVIIIDELADLMMVAAKEIEGAICRLAQMARAVGMHLIVATQRPSTNVITGVIKANFPSRIAFAVSSKVDSKVILDCMGADKLLGRGDMLYLPVGEPKPVRVQGAFISEEEVKRLTGFLRDNARPEYVDIHADLVQAQAPPEPAEVALADEMWEPALRAAVELGHVSTSLLQRHLSIGYNRAARIIDAMFDRGIISGQTSGKRRKVLISEAQIDEYLN